MTANDVSPAERTVTRAFVWATLFPYLSPGSFLRIDTQPWALVLAGAGFVLAARRLAFARLHWALCVLAIAAVFMWLVGSRDLGAIRTVAGYLSLFLIAVMATHALRIDQRATLWAIDISLIVWLAVGLLQRLVWRGALTWLVSAARTSETRGVIGLAPEPTYYASTILLIVLWRATIGLERWHVVTAIVVAVALASSAQVVAVIALAAVIYAASLLTRPRLIAPIALLAVGGVAALSILTAYLQDSRLGVLVDLLVNRPTLLLADQSINDRATQIFTGVYSVWDRSFVPNGIDGPDWVAYVNEIIVRFPNVFWAPQTNDRIMSGVGAILFQLGFLSLFLIWAFVVDLCKWPAPARYRVTWAVAFLLLFATAIPLAHPLLAAALGGLAFSSARSREQRA